METPKILELVSEFQQVFAHPIETKPMIPSDARSKLRIALIKEEVEELEKSISNNNLVEVADALCDLQYVLAGTILEFGFGDKFKSIFNEIHLSNMSKACKSEKEANATINYYKEKENISCYYKIDGNNYLVYRNSDNKVMKSINYSPPEIRKILNNPHN
jgi:predicted HAD superfamily Cof-like phosphohydrolase